MKWPTNRTITDKDGKITDPWMGPLKILEPLLNLTPAQFVVLQAIIRAAQEADETDQDTLSTLIAALAVDAVPDFNADFLTSYDTSAQLAKRIPIGLVGRSSLITTMQLSGSAEVNVSVPAGYTDLRVVLKGVSGSGTSSFRIHLSEDNGATFLIADLHLFNQSDTNAGTTADAEWVPIAIVAANSASGRITIFDYQGSGNKIVDLNGIEPASSTAWTGTMLFTSTAPINLLKASVTPGTFDAGSLELWGTP